MFIHVSIRGSHTINSSDGTLTVCLDNTVEDAFKELIQRGANLWPDAPWQIKELADLITSGQVMQNYQKQEAHLQPTPEQKGTFNGNEWTAA